MVCITRVHGFTSQPKERGTDSERTIVCQSLGSGFSVSRSVSLWLMVPVGLSVSLCLTVSVGPSVSLSVLWSLSVSLSLSVSWSLSVCLSLWLSLALRTHYPRRELNPRLHIETPRSATRVPGCVAVRSKGVNAIQFRITDDKIYQYYE